MRPAACGELPAGGRVIVLGLPQFLPHVARNLLKPQSMLTNKVLVVCAATTLLAGVVTVGGCSRSPQARELRFLKRGKDLVAQKDLGRALLEFKSG